MFKHSLCTAAASLIVLGPVTIALAADEKKDEPSMHMTMEHCDDSMPKGVETAKTSADHEAIAQHYDAEAKQFDAQATRHEALAEHYAMGHGGGPKANTASLAQHCKNLVKNLKASAQEAREMAQLHRELGKALAK